MNKLLHDDQMTAEALALYAGVKGLNLVTEQIDHNNTQHQESLRNCMIGPQSLPIMLLANGSVIATTHSIIDYIEATRKAPRILSTDPTPNPEQVATIHLFINAIQRNLYINAHTLPANPKKAHDTWITQFALFFINLLEGQQFIADTGFSILVCFFFPATNIYLAIADQAKPHDKCVLHSYRERVMHRTLYASDPNRNPAIWEDIV
jgi:glutathione S-transferase